MDQIHWHPMARTAESYTRKAARHHANAKIEQTYVTATQKKMADHLEQARQNTLASDQHDRDALQHTDKAQRAKATQNSEGSREAARVHQRRHDEWIEPLATHAQWLNKYQRDAAWYDTQRKGGLAAWFRAKPKSVQLPVPQIPSHLYPT